MELQLCPAFWPLHLRSSVLRVSTLHICYSTQTCKVFLNRPHCKICNMMQTHELLDLSQRAQGIIQTLQNSLDYSFFKEIEADFMSLETGRSHR